MTEQPPPLPLWTEDDLDSLSLVTVADIDAAMKQWREDVPRVFRNLLDAQPEEDVTPAA
jgi:hypothetical protein